MPEKVQRMMSDLLPNAPLAAVAIASVFSSAALYVGAARAARSEEAEWRRSGEWPAEAGRRNDEAGRQASPP